MPKGDNAGRPMTGTVRMRTYPVTLPPALAAQARALGGNLSATVRSALVTFLAAAAAQEPARELQVWRHVPTAACYVIVWAGALAAAHGPMSQSAASAVLRGERPLPQVADADLTDWADLAWERGEMQRVEGGA